MTPKFQVQDLRDPSDPDSGVHTVASRHTMITVLPGRRKQEQQQRQRGSRNGRRRHRTEEDQQRPLETSASASAADRERRTQSLRAPSSSESEDGSGVTLGPVSERVVMVRQGGSVVIECRDADADSRVYWTKHGGEQRSMEEPILEK